MHVVVRQLAGLVRGERIIVVLFLALAVWYGYETLHFQKIMMEDVVGPATFPRVIAVASIILGILYLYQNRERTDTDDTVESATIGEQLVDLIPLALTLAYVLFLEPLGFLPATVVYIALTMRYLGQSWARASLYSVLLSLLFFIVFYFGLKAEIPMGRWIPLEDMFPSIVHLREVLGG